MKKNSIKELEERLYSKYPELLDQYKKSPRETCLCWGLIPGPGWKDIMYTMCGTLDKLRKEKYPDLRLTQIKEKWGSLRVYWEGGSLDDGVQNVIDTAEALSIQTCIVCGKPGKLIQNGWIRCHCDECEDAYQKERRPK